MTSRSNVVDSSAWLAWFANEPGAGSFADAIEDTDALVIPSICLAEVFKVIARQRGEGDALQAIAFMSQGRVVNLDANLAISAAVEGLAHKLPLADSIVYATARANDATLWTQDEDFEGIPGVRFIRKRK
ncbi:MAG: type II toxin-antitoxin system VapC family toxin [Gemmatimonadaceae bacterium]